MLYLITLHLSPLLRSFCPVQVRSRSGLVLTLKSLTLKWDSLFHLLLRCPSLGFCRRQNPQNIDLSLTLNGCFKILTNELPIRISGQGHQRTFLAWRYKKQGRSLKVSLLAVLVFSSIYPQFLLSVSLYHLLLSKQPVQNTYQSYLGVGVHLRFWLFLLPASLLCSPILLDFKSPYWINN